MGLIAFLLFIFACVNCKIIKNLPGFVGKTEFELYGDYVDIPDTQRSYFYLFAESYNNSKTTPLVLWLNGGPGCSSIQGFSLENGPFLLQYDAKTLLLNENSWNKVANMIYLEAPAGVGFSIDRSKEKTKWNDEIFASDVYQFILEFLKEFPEYSDRDFYVSGESYAGYYIPVLVNHIIDQNKKRHNQKINFKGFIIGNGLVDDKNDVNSLPEYLRNHLIITDKDYDHVMDVCKGDPYENMNNTQCSKVYEDVTFSIFYTGINPYFLYDICLPERPFLKAVHVPVYDQSQQDVGVHCAGMLEMAKYFNRTDVKLAIHANANISWTACSFDVIENYKRIYTSMFPFYKKILPKYRGLFFSGDCDSIVNGIGSRKAFEDLGLKQLKPWAVWKVGKLPAGMITKYENMIFLTVRGSGHMSSIQKPVENLEMFSKFLEGNCC